MPSISPWTWVEICADHWAMCIVRRCTYSRSPLWRFHHWRTRDRKPCTHSSQVLVFPPAPGFLITKSLSASNTFMYHRTCLNQSSGQKQSQWWTFQYLKDAYLHKRVMPRRQMMHTMLLSQPHNMAVHDAVIIVVDQSKSIYPNVQSHGVKLHIIHGRLADKPSDSPRSSW